MKGVDTGSWNWKERLKCFEVGYGPPTRVNWSLYVLLTFPFHWKKSTRCSFGDDRLSYFLIFYFLYFWAVGLEWPSLEKENIVRC